MRDVATAARVLMNADAATLDTITQRDPDMIRDVAAALVNRLHPEPEKNHNEDCELRGGGPCYCQ